jgi:hypothetical protein
MNVYILYINKIQYGDIEPLGQYSSLTEASEHINENIEKYYPNIKYVKIDKNCTIDNALITIDNNTTHIIKSIPMRTEIYSVQYQRGYFGSARISKLESVISILEIIHKPFIPQPPQPPLIEPKYIPKLNKPLVNNINKNHNNDDYNIELINAIKAREDRMKKGDPKIKKIQSIRKPKLAPQFSKQEISIMLDEMDFHF